ncbi:hypothetical protein LOD99_3394 [Oopsacas minuta]|uniref:VWFA domain-containing protein n=1 Tax=Oopsacas minuta TaxID=111878 RepID=A0AAV7JXR1_9METZ|nr:hypothetical protein LOD99_3394 [Oopsacas minuta]
MNRREMKKADVASVLLFTDGLANCGITNTNDILTAMQNIFAGKKDFTVNTFGFGSDHNAYMLEEISRVGNGLYYFIQKTEQIPEIFTNCLGGLLSTVGQDISISIETSNGATIKAIFSKENPSLSNGNKKGVVGMGDLQSEEERDILVELNLPTAKNTTSSYTYANVTLEYFNVIKKYNDHHQREVVIERQSDLSTQKLSLEVDEQRNRIQTIDSLARAAELAEKGKMKEASKVLTSRQSCIRSSHSQTSPRVISLDNDLNTAMENLSSEAIYSSRGRYAIASITGSHAKQRSTTTPSYNTSSRTTTLHHYENIMSSLSFYEHEFSQPTRKNSEPIDT